MEQQTVDYDKWLILKFLRADGLMFCFTRAEFVVYDRLMLVTFLSTH